MSAPEQVWQLVHPQLPARFPLLKSPDVLSVGGLTDADDDEPDTDGEVSDAPGQRPRLAYKLTDAYSGTPDGRRSTGAGAPAPEPSPRRSRSDCRAGGNGPRWRW